MEDLDRYFVVANMCLDFEIVLGFSKRGHVVRPLHCGIHFLLLEQVLIDVPYQMR